MFDVGVERGIAVRVENVAYSEKGIFLFLMFLKGLTPLSGLNGILFFSH